MSEGAAPTPSAYELLGEGAGTPPPDRAHPAGPSGGPPRPALAWPDHFPDHAPAGLVAVTGAFGSVRRPLGPPRRATRPGPSASFRAARLAAVLAVIATLVPLSVFAVHLAARSGLTPPAAGSPGRAAGVAGRAATPESPASTPGQHPGRRAASASRAGRRPRLHLGRRDRSGGAVGAVAGAAVAGSRHPGRCTAPPVGDTGRGCGRHRSLSERRAGLATVG